MSTAQSVTRSPDDRVLITVVHPDGHSTQHYLSITAAEKLAQDLYNVCQDIRGDGDNCVVIPDHSFRDFTIRPPSMGPTDKWIVEAKYGDTRRAAYLYPDSRWRSGLDARGHFDSYVDAMGALEEWRNLPF